MNASDYEKARDVAVEAAQEAARLIRQHAGRLAQGAVREKQTHDLVTHVDEEAQQLIIDRLRRDFPEVDVLAEESGGDAEAPGGGGTRWIIDPIDGTTNFTRGVPPYAVSIGLENEGRIVVGVVLDVAHRELFTAVRGGGLFVNGARAGVSRTGSLSDALLTTGFPYRAFEHVDAYLQVMRRFMHEARGLRRPGSASVDLAWVACGRFDGFFETGLLPWDVAAGMLLVEEGGGRVSDFSAHPYPISGRQLLATNGLLHDVMLEVVAPLGRF